MNPKSPLAVQIASPPPARERETPIPFGLCVHTTGRTLVQKAKLKGENPIDRAVKIFNGPGANYPHYVIAADGDIVQILADNLRGRHAGVPRAEREAYLNGSWTRDISAVGLQMWRERWPDHKSPQHLYPSRSPNDDYLGVELIPSMETNANGTWFTDAQYAALRSLIDDIQSRHQITLTGNRLVGHEDLEPLTRWNSLGGWDPGAIRVGPRFRWDLIPAEPICR